MKALLVVVLALSALYSGYWFIATRGLEGGLQSAITAAENNGWQIETETLETSGFPSRFDVTATGMTVVSPSRDLAWQLPQIQTAALSYRPNRVIATFPQTQTVQVGQQTLTIGSQGLRANFGVAASPALTFEALTAEALSFDVRSDAGWTVTTGEALAAMRPMGPAANTYEGYLSLSDIAPKLPLVDLPDARAQMTADVTATLDRPLDRVALATPALLEKLTLNAFDLSWGKMNVAGEGDIAVDSTGFPEGRILLRITNWRDMLDLLERSDAVDPNMLPALTAGLRMLSGGSDSLKLPLTFAGGAMMLGPLPLGPAPRLR